jgi:hypothetical protein
MVVCAVASMVVDVVMVEAIVAGVGVGVVVGAGAGAGAVAVAVAVFCSSDDL